MNKIQILCYNFAGEFSNKWKKTFLWIAGFRNIEDMKIVYRQKFYTMTLTMGSDGVIHRVLNLRTMIDTKM